MALTRYSGNRNEITANINSKIYRAVQNNKISSKTYVTSSGDRLDHIAFKEYGDGLNWWVIAAASGIGWWMQMPEGIVLKIPTDLNEIESLKDL